MPKVVRAEALFKGGLEIRRWSEKLKQYVTVFVTWEEIRASNSIVVKAKRSSNKNKRLELLH